MKKTFQILGAAMLALAVVGCENEPIDEGNTPVTPDEPVVEEPAELVLCATLPETRTTLTPEENGNGYKLEWSEGDGITVFQAETGTTPESWTNYKFDIDEEVKGEFTPAEGVEVPFEEGKNYDWYVVYPYSTNNEVPTLKTPLGQSKEDGYFAIGATTQYGYNNTDHIAGMDIMVGKAKDTREPNVTLKHLAVLHKFTVTNNSDQPTVIQKLTVTGNTNIFGAFWIDLTADEPKIDLTKANNTADSFKTRGLTIKGALDEDGNELAAEELAVGASADFYMITAPFTLATGETFKVTITTSTGEQTLEKTATADIEFKAGTYNTANLVYDYVPAPIVYADHLFSDTFESNFTNKDKVNTSNTTMSPARWNSYDMSSVTVYDGDTSSVKYSYEGNVTINCQQASVIVGMDGFFVWFQAGAKLTVSGIKLYDYTDLTLSFNQTYKGSGITTEYSVDGGETWNTIGVSAHPAAGNSMATYSYDFSVPADSETISLRFTASTSTPRMDNVKLAWRD